MPKDIQKIFSFLSKKRVILFVLIFIILGLFFFSQPAVATEIWQNPARWFGEKLGFVEVEHVSSTGGKGVISWTAAKIIDVLIAVVVTFLQIPLFIAAIFLKTSSWILQFAIDPAFINVSYTNIDNPIIKVGWPITRDLANMGIVLVLVVIGLATIVRIESYQFKKTLFPLVVIALLINFTPVILGLVVDASNILMYSFLKSDLNFSKLTNFLSKGISEVGEAWNEIPNKSGEETGPFASMINLEPLGRTVVLISFGFIAGLIYLIFAILFICRYVAIWTLVILSPIAFIAYILPATRGIFSAWWKQFFHWCFIGVIAAFFLFLSSNMLIWADSNQTLHGQTNLINPNIPDFPSGDKNFPGLFDTLLPYSVVIVFLIFGLIASLTTSAKGALAAVNLTKRGAKWTGKKAWKAVRPERILKPAAGWVTKKAESTPLLRHFFPEIIKKYAEARPSVDKTKAELGVFSSRSIGDKLVKGLVKGHEATGAMIELVNRGDSQDLFGAAQRMGWGKNDEQTLNDPRFKKVVGGVLKTAFSSGYHSHILRRDPRLAAVAAGKKWAFGYSDMDDTKDAAGNITETKEEKGITKAAQEVRPPHIANMEKEILLNKTIVKAFMGKGRTIAEAVDSQIKMGRETMQETVNEIFKEFVDTISPTFSKLSQADKDTAMQNSVKHDQALSEFRQHIKKTQGGDGYFVALEGTRLKERGWTPPQYKGETAPTVTARPSIKTKREKARLAWEALFKEPEETGGESKPSKPKRPKKEEDETGEGI